MRALPSTVGAFAEGNVQAVTARDWYHSLRRTVG